MGVSLVCGGGSHGAEQRFRLNEVRVHQESVHFHAQPAAWLLSLCRIAHLSVHLRLCIAQS